MGEYIGRINVSKDSMLFVLNDVFERNIKESMTKENILKIVPKVYESTDAKEIIKMIPYDSYLLLEKLIKYIKVNDDVKNFFSRESYRGERYLEEAMIVVMRAKHMEYNYSLNPGVIEKLQKIFTKENRELAQKYGSIEKLTMGMLYSYGVVEFNTLKTKLCKYIGEVITDEELYDLFFKRLNLNLDVNYFSIRWTNNNQFQEFVTYLDEEQDEVDVYEIATEQKSRGLKYKKFKEQELLDREEYLWDKSTQSFYDFISSKNKNLWKYSFQRIIKRSELGENILDELLNICRFQDENEIDEFMGQYMKWYNNSPQYVLGGYSPIEFRIFG